MLQYPKATFLLRSGTLANSDPQVAAARYAPFDEAEYAAGEVHGASIVGAAACSVDSFVGVSEDPLGIQKIKSKSPTLESRDRRANYYAPNSAPTEGRKFE